MKHLRSIRALVVLGALVALAVFVVLPAVASTPGDSILPASTAGITPVDVPIGGNGVCAKIFPSLQGFKEYDNPNPQTASNLASGNNDGVRFSLVVSGGNQSQRLAVTSTGASILAMGIKGGNDTAAYNYGASPVTGDSNLHAPGSKFTVSGTVESPTQWYGLSELNICYAVAEAPVSGTATSGGSALSGSTVTVSSTTSSFTRTGTTGADGGYSISVPSGDSYKVCIASPGSGYVETTPATGAACPSGQAAVGYTVTSLPAAGRSSLDFAFQPFGSVSGTVYNDLNQSGANDAGDAALGGWTVRLYTGVTAGTAGGGTLLSSTQTAVDGTYGFSLAFDTTKSYRVCEVAPAGTTWAQSKPLPSTTNLCTGSGELAKGYDITPSSLSETDGSKDFGNVGSVAQGTCPPSSPFGLADLSYLIQLAGCKPGVTYVFAQGTTPPNNTPFVSVWSSDATQAPMPMVEKITIADPIDATSGQPTYTKLKYTDTFPFLPANFATMKYCLKDPRSSEFGLNAPYDTATTGVIPAGETSCAISITTYVDASGNGKMRAYVYSAIDGLRTTG